MKSLGILVCASLLAGCTSGAMQQSVFPARQEFGYPRVQSLPLPALAPAAAASVPAEPSPVAATAVAPADKAPQRASAAVAVEPEGASYDEKKDPIMRNLLAQATQPVDEEANMVNGRLVLPPTAKLDIIDIHDVSETLRSAASPSS